MVLGVGEERETRGPATSRPTLDATSLDGETVIVRKTDRGYVLEPTSPRLIGMTVPGYFVPDASANPKRIHPVSTEKASKVLKAHLERDPATPAPVPPMGVINDSTLTPTEDLRDRHVLRWKALRESFLRENRSVTAAELAGLTGSRSRIPSSRAHEWMRAGKIFAVHDGTTARYPLFQFDEREGRPKPEIRDIIAHLREQLSNWEIAFWFVTANGWTGDWRRPVDLLGREPERVVDAACHEVAEKVL